MTPEERAELRRLAEAATLGPWAAEITTDDRLFIYTPSNEKTRDFYVACRDTVLSLLDALDAAEAKVARLREALVDARGDMFNWAAYADEYFRKKHDFAGDLARIDAILAETEPEECSGV